MQKQDKDILFARWLDDQLNQDEQAEFERLCREDREFSEQVATMSKFESLSQDYEEVAVPEWNRSATIAAGASSYHRQVSKPWWQWSGFPLLSFATSMAAILMVTLKLQVNITDSGVLIGFADNYDKTQIQSMLDERLTAYQTTQNSQLQQYTAQLQDQQKQLNAQFAEYLLSANRTERKQDFAELIKFVNQQRADDQVYYARQLTRLERDIAYRLPEDTWQAQSGTNPITLDE